jgi:hypothetical protein
VWQQLQEEFAAEGLAIIAVAIDSDLEAVREWAETAPGLTVLIDRDFVVAEKYGIVNVPATVWINEDGQIVRPADTAMGDDRFRAFAHIDSAVHHDHLRTWVATNQRDLDDEEVAEHMVLPTAQVQQARLHLRLAVLLHDRGDTEGMNDHLAQAHALAPHDWVVRRGSMPMQGHDPFGMPFFEFVQEWNAAGSPGYTLQTGREGTIGL